MTAILCVVSFLSPIAMVAVPQISNVFSLKVRSTYGLDWLCHYNDLAPPVWKVARKCRRKFLATFATKNHSHVI